MTKFLARLGWRIRILTARPEYYEPLSHDPTLLNEVEETTRITRVRSLQPRGRMADALLAEVSGARATAPGRMLSGLLRVARVVHRLLIPDDKILWVPPAFLRALHLLLRDRPTAIYVSSPPHSSLVLAWLVSVVGRRPLILDLRDDWVGNPLYGQLPSWRQTIESALQARIMHRASAVILPTPTSKQALIRRFPGSALRVHVIPNGFDDEDLSRDPRPISDIGPDDPDVLTCIYAGLINARRDLRPLLQAIQRVKMTTGAHVRLTLAGFIPSSVRAIIDDLGLQHDVEVTGYLPHAEVLHRISSSDIAVLLSTRAEGAATAIPSKLFEYVACGAYVLGLVDPGATASLISERGWGSVCAPDEAAAIADALARCARLKKTGELQRGSRNGDLIPFTRRAQAEKLDAILCDVVGIGRN